MNAGERSEAGGVWVAYYSDSSSVIPFPNEIDALRAAVAHQGGDSVVFVRWGESIRDAEARERQAL